MKRVWTTAARTSGLWRFLRAGVADAVDRLSRLTRRETPDEGSVVRVVEASWLAARADRAFAVAAAAARTSLILGAAAPRWRAWRAQSEVARTRGTGVGLLTAAAVYVLLSLWHRPVAGWLWLVPPAVASGFGALMALAPSRTSRPAGSR